jgi:2'-5' RNA ligase
MKILFEKIEAKVQEVGFEPNQGNFVPHVTIGRIKNILNKKRFSELISQLQPTSSQNLSIHNWSLYQSKLNNKGVEYRIIKDWNREDAY